MKQFYKHKQFQKAVLTGKFYLLGVFILFAVLSISTQVSFFSVGTPFYAQKSEEKEFDKTLSLEEAEGIAVHQILFHKLVEGEETQAPPVGARGSEVQNILRTTKGQRLQKKDIKADLLALRETYAFFASVQVRFVQTEQGLVDVVFVCEDQKIAQIKVLELVGGGYQKASPELNFQVQSAYQQNRDQEFSLSNLDSMVERLHQIGNYIDIKQEWKYTQSGVVLTIRLVRAESIDRVLLAGIYDGEQETLENMLEIKERGSLRRDLLAQARFQIQEYYKNEGFPFADSSVHILVFPEAGKESSRSGLAERFPELSEAALEKLEDEAEPGEKILLFDIHEGPHVQIAEFHFKGLERLVDLPQSQALEPGKLPTSYWPLWYALPFTEREDRVKRALYSVMENGKTLFTAKPDFVLEKVLQDAFLIQSHLRQNGWRDAEVSLKDVDYNDDRSRVEVTYDLRPGPVYLLNAVAVRVKTHPLPGNPEGDVVEPVLGASEVFEILNLQGGISEQVLQDLQLHSESQQGFHGWQLQPTIPYNSALFEGNPLDPLDKGVYQDIKNAFGEKGYSRAQVNSQEVFLQAESALNPTEEEGWQKDQHFIGVALLLDVDQGQRFRIRRISVRGNKETKTNVIRRQLRIFPGEVFSIEEMDKAANRLRRLRWFDQGTPGAGVMIHPLWTEEVDPDDKHFLFVDLLVEVQEGNTGSANFSAGFSPGVGVTVSLAVSKQNFDIFDLPSFTGAGQSISLTLEPPVAQRQRYAFSFSEPFLFGYPLEGRLEISVQELDFGPFTRAEAGGRISFGYNLFRDLNLRVSYENFENEVKEVARGASFEIREEEGETRLAAIGLEAVYNTLNRQVFPTEGYRFSLEELLAWENFGGNVNLWRITARAKQAFLIYEIDEVREIALSIQALSTVQREFGSSDRVPLSQRLFLGSISPTNSLRGFERAGVGPSAGDDPIGGNFLVNATAEISVEVAPAFFWLVSFIDAGQLVQNIENFDASGITVSGGFGFRLQLPIAPLPIGVDFAWPLYNQPGNQEEVVAINLAFGF